MIRIRQALTIILLCIVLLASCFDEVEYSRYELEEIENRQYILTSPDGILYETYENNIWYPEVFYGEDVSDAVGKCHFGYVYETTSEICFFTTDLHARNQHYFFLEGTVLPELSIENVNNAVLEDSYQRDLQIVVDEETIEQLINLYNSTETHEVKDIKSMERIWELFIECEQFKGLYFMKPIYSDETDFYLFVSFQYDSTGRQDGAIVSKCTSAIESIQPKEKETDDEVMGNQIKIDDVVFDMNAKIE